VSYDEAAEVAEPADCAFDGPAMTITAKLAAVLRSLPFAAFAMRTNQMPALLGQSLAKRIAVVSAIGDQWDDSAFRPRGLFKRAFGEFNYSWRRARGGTCQRNSLAICHHHPLRTLSTLGFADVGAPFFAGAKLPSRNTCSQSTSPRSSSVSRNACHISTNTPASFPLDESSPAGARRGKPLG
jgi:hypothetical protein